ncbi:hypothetical protein V6N11_052348 [Hibiscus sabdariffa]|uniref:RRM domain-containing protein n=2 Tax=Hibiscus sabdariffa TaxID=183260 RepID=A0ABR1ZLM5_9ROSI
MAMVPNTHHKHHQVNHFLVVLAIPINTTRLRDSLPSILVDRISKRIHRTTLWNDFSTYGKVVDVYIAYGNRKRLHQKHTFAFVRFDSKTSMLNAIEAGNRRKIDGFYISVSEARSRKVPIGNNVRRPARKQPSKMANTVSTKNLRDNRTYMEALIGSGRENEMRRRVSVDNFDCGLEQRNVRAEPEEFLKVKVGGLNSQVEIPIKEMCWLSRCLADKIKPIKEQLQDPWFEFIEPVAVSEEHQRVKVWVSLEEVPLCLWHPSFFSFIGNTWGSLIEIDKSTVANECFEFARMLVMVERVSDIPSSISVLKVNSCSSEEDNPSHRNNLGQWEDLWASESEPNIGIESTNNQDSDKINGSGINVEMEGVEEATPNLPNENDTLESQGLDCSTKRGPHVGTSVDPNPQSVGLHEVPIVNMAFPDSDSSSFCLRNENGLLISGRGIPTFGQSSKSKPKRKNNRRCRFCTGVRITSPWNWPCRNTSPSLSNSMELRKKDQFSLSGQAVPVGEVDIGAKTSSPSGPSVDFAGTSQYKVTEATNTLEVGNLVGFRFKGDRAEILRQLARLKDQT